MENTGRLRGSFRHGRRRRRDTLEVGCWGRQSTLGAGVGAATPSKPPPSAHSSEGPAWRGSRPRSLQAHGQSRPPPRALVALPRARDGSRATGHLPCQRAARSSAERVMWRSLRGAVGASGASGPQTFLASRARWSGWWTGAFLQLV